MKKLAFVILSVLTLSGCIMTSVVSGTVGTAVDAVDLVTPDIVD